MTGEGLLKKLIEKGWKPRGFEKVYNFGIENGYTVLNTKKASYISFATSCVFREDYGEEQEMDYVSYTYRELVSKESGLWQFVCENGMVLVPKGEIPYVERNYIFDYECYEVSEFQYWLMVGALLKEDELEQFLLDNIKIGK